MSEKSFPSKVLLFGEYSVIKHSNALAMPYHLFEGKLTFRRGHQGDRDGELRALVSYLKQCQSSNELDFDFDINSFEFDVGQGLVFDSSIPQGYGVGSSGALVAALCETYCPSLKEIKDVSELKRRFAMIESHFHGSSSGFDPLISFLDRPIFKDKDSGTRVVNIDNQISDDITLFLLNTGRSRKTEPLVNLFLEKCKSSDFASECETKLAPITDRCIDYYLTSNSNALWDAFYELSSFQYEHFKPMIPKLFHDLWEQGLNEKEFLLKLCGAGGGGFLMGMTKDFRECSRKLSSFELRPL